MSKRILITGAGGFVGLHLLEELKNQEDNEIYGAVYQGSSEIKSLLSNDHLIAGDLTNPNYCDTLIKQTRPNIIYHLASLSVVHGSIHTDLELMNANIVLQYNLLQSVANHASNARFIAVCSANEYGLVKPNEVPIKESQPLRPLNPYAISKVAQEMLAQQYYLTKNLDVVILRPFNHTGPGQTLDFVVPQLAKQFVEIERGQKNSIEVGNLGTTRDFTDVRDMVKAYIAAAEQGQSGEVYNIGSGIGITVKEIIEMFKKITGLQVELKTNESAVRPSDVPILIADATKFKNLTNWQPKISLETTLSDILEHWRHKS